LAVLALVVAFGLGCDALSSASADEPPAKSTGSKAAKAAATAKPTVDDGSIPPPKTVEALPIREGQWVRFDIDDGKGNGKRKFSYAVIGKEGDAHWLDVMVEQPTGAVSVQILVSIPDRNDASQVKIKKFKVKLPTGQVQTFSGATVAAAQQQFKSFMARFAIPKFAGLPQEDVTVPAGRFRGCYKRTEKVELLGLKDESSVWNHTAVPIMAMVKLVSKDGTTFELTGYGLTGAKPTF
jgi:hypothetical protein